MLVPFDNIPWYIKSLYIGLPFLCYLIIAGLAYLVFYVIFKRRAKNKKIQMNYTDSKIVKQEFRYSLISLMIFTVIGLSILIALKFGITKIYFKMNDYGSDYFIFSIFLIIVLHDTYFYWTHRFMHMPGVFKYVHRTHHSFINPTPLSAFAFSPLETMVHGSFLPLFIFIIPVHYVSIGVFFIFMVISNVIGHLGFEFYPDRFTKNWFGKWLITSTYHNMHHKEVAGNFGLYFSFWDKIMKTECKDYKEQMSPNDSLHFRDPCK